MSVAPSLLRKATAALALAVPCLLFATPAEASPVRKAHVRPHKAAAHRRVVTPAQAFARLASRGPERRVVRHPASWLQKTQGAPNANDHDAAIQTTVTPASTAAQHAAPDFQPLELLAPAQALFRSHDGFAHRSPRAPPVCG